MAKCRLAGRMELPYQPVCSNKYHPLPFIAEPPLWVSVVLRPIIKKDTSDVLTKGELLAIEKAEQEADFLHRRAAFRRRT